MPLPEELAGLLASAAYAHPVGPLRLIETYISWVVLTGPFAYKIKRPVRLDFIDFSTPERREFFCREELRLNRRFAPELYLDVVPVTRDNGAARIGGAGPVIAHAVRMRQFDAVAELHAQLDTGLVQPRDFSRLGARVAQVHALEPPRPLPGGAQGTLRVIADNLQQCRAAVAGMAVAGDLGMIGAALDRRAREAREIFGAREAAGRVRECHGDLHISNVVRWDDALLPFDCLEFEESFRVIDVAQEIAFLHMDLAAQGYGACASAFLNGYLEVSGDFAAARLLPLFATHYALVRAKVNALNVRLTTEPARQARLHGRLALYLKAARDWLAPRQPRCVLVGGLSGSGKSWLAARLALALPGIHVRSDVERKRLAGLPPGAKSGSAPGADLYTAARDDATYERLAAIAADVIAAGRDVIVDATFLSRARRADFLALARRLGAGHALLWCEADQRLLVARIAARNAAGTDASEADLAILAHQQFRVERPDAGEPGLAVVDTGRPEPDRAALGILTGQH